MKTGYNNVEEVSKCSLIYLKTRKGRISGGVNHMEKFNWKLMIGKYNSLSGIFLFFPISTFVLDLICNISLDIYSKFII